MKTLGLTIAAALAWPLGAVAAGSEAPPDAAQLIVQNNESLLAPEQTMTQTGQGAARPSVAEVAETETDGDVPAPVETETVANDVEPGMATSDEEGASPVESMMAANEDASEVAEVAVTPTPAEPAGSGDIEPVDAGTAEPGAAPDMAAVEMADETPPEDEGAVTASEPVETAIAAGEDPATAPMPDEDLDGDAMAADPAPEAVAVPDTAAVVPEVEGTDAETAMVAGEDATAAPMPDEDLDGEADEMAADPAPEAEADADPSPDTDTEMMPEVEGAGVATASAESVETPDPVLADGDDMTGDAESDATATEDIIVAAVEPAPDPVPEPAPAPAPAPVDPMIEACRTQAPEASAGVPAAAAEAAARRDALAAAAAACTDAAAADDAPADVLFLAGEIAQGRRDVAAAFRLFSRAATAEFGPAETRLGDYYLFGLAPGGEDSAEAIAHYEAAVALGDAPGMTTLALMYRVGKGVPRDPGRMVSLLGDAADAGYHFAAYRLAQTYLNGEGIPGRSDESLGIPDPAKAARLFTEAAEAGNITAALELAALYGDPRSGLPDNPRDQARLTLMASRAGLPEATAAMGVLYEIGRGVEKNPDVAALLYVKALESGKVSFDAVRKGAPEDWDFDTAVAFQKILEERGLYDGGLDGVVGAGTSAGARALAGN